MTSLSSRERLIRALSSEEVDHVPCCFMSFSALRKRLKEDRYQLARAEREMGLDPMLFIPAASRGERPEHPDLRGLPVRFSPKVAVENRVDSDRILVREYRTPAGTLSVRVRTSDDWPHGLRIPFIDDYQIPRMEKPLIEGPEDLDSLNYLLCPPDQEDVEAYRKEAEVARRFAAEEGVLLAGGWGVGVDMLAWLCGLQNLILLTLDQPDFVKDLLGRIHRWNLERMKVVLSGPVDLYIRRAWYEGCDFVTPQFDREALLPLLRAEAELAHERGARFGLICSSGVLPLTDCYRDAGIDALIGIDPVQGTHTDLAQLKHRLGDEVCLWGGVSGAVTVEMGSEQEVRAAVRSALDTLGPRGFILSPVDNITEDTPRTWENLDHFINEWKR
ncbi:MAG: hypothetical protein JSU96_04510 [Acidobacteriota bacterium]|nr:MAG: hypothetical protein JSU96_04510 [Acidobacteriota bacterium]